MFVNIREYLPFLILVIIAYSIYDRYCIGIDFFNIGFSIYDSVSALT